MRRRGKWTIQESERPEPLRPEAFHGLAGEIVRAIEPHTEADPAALLIQFLVAFGFVIGRCAHYLADGAQHSPNLFVIVVGETSKSRKGTSWSRVRTIFGSLRMWPNERVKSGLSTGEGVIKQVDDSTYDKRLLVAQGEFGSTIRVMERRGNQLSQVLRDAWDGSDLHILTRNVPLSASGHHIAMIAHITRDELLARVDDTELWNGFANRFLWCAARRVRLLPHGGSVHDSVLQPLIARLDDSVKWAQSLSGRRVTWDTDAATEWEQVYFRLAAGATGVLGSVTGRAEAQVVRIALIFALLDKSEVIRREHLGAAVAVWGYCEASARCIFGGALGDAVAAEILHVLRLNPTGLTRSAISGVFGRHRSAAEIGRALSLLEQQGLARKELTPTVGRPVERWFAVSQNCETGEKGETASPRFRVMSFFHASANSESSCFEEE